MAQLLAFNINHHLDHNASVDTSENTSPAL